jgi:hypothetical protein
VLTSNYVYLCVLMVYNRCGNTIVAPKAMGTL